MKIPSESVIRKRNLIVCPTSDQHRWVHEQASLNRISMSRVGIYGIERLMEADRAADVGPPPPMETPPDDLTSRDPRSVNRRDPPGDPSVSDRPEHLWSDDAERAVDAAEKIAREAHIGQIDKAGRPYVEHLERVARMVQPAMRAAAWLHDVLEHTRVTAGDLINAGIDEATVRSVQTLARRIGENMKTYIRRVATSGDPRAVW